MDKIDAIAEVCRSLALNGTGAGAAVKTLEAHYPFDPKVFTKRRYTPLESTLVFVRDGFIDRYSGEKLVFPPVFRIISRALPDKFPFQPNWKTDETHPAYWELGATVDHLVPVTLGGLDEESNWLTTSMAHNSAKMNWTLEQLGWRLCGPGDVNKWDGLLGWFLDYATANPEALKNSSVKQWHIAATHDQVRSALQKNRRRNMPNLVVALTGNDESDVEIGGELKH